MIEFVLRGQIKSGKNNMVVTRTGRHFPRAAWAAWRNNAVAQILAAGPFKMLEVPAVLHVKYFAGDRRRRDVPGMLDALCHVFERVKLVKDDSLVKDVHWFSEYDKADPRAGVIIHARSSIGVDPREMVWRRRNKKNIDADL